MTKEREQLSFEEVAERFGIGTTSVFRYPTQKQNTNQIDEVHSNKVHDYFLNRKFDSGYFIAAGIKNLYYFKFQV